MSEPDAVSIAGLINRMKQAELRASRNADAAETYREQVSQLTERCRWWNEMRQDAEVKLGRLAEAARPYVDRAAPHEQLFSGEDIRNLDRLRAALAEANELLRTGD